MLFGLLAAIAAAGFAFRQRIVAIDLLQPVRTAVIVLAIALVITAYFHWRGVGRASGLFVATGALPLTAIAVLDRWQATSLAAATPTPVRFGLSVAAAAWIARAIFGPDVDASLAPWLEIVRCAAVVLAGTAVAFVASMLGISDVLLWFAVALLWATAGVAGAVRAMERAWTLAGWVSWCGVALAVSEGVYIFDVASESSWLLVGQGARTMGLLIGVIGASLGLSQVAVSWRGLVHGIEVEGRQRLRQLESERRLRHHELSNAFLTVEGASLTLERYQDRLSDADRQYLYEALYRGIATLRELVADQPATATESLPLVARLGPGAATPPMDEVDDRRQAVEQQ